MEIYSKKQYLRLQPILCNGLSKSIPQLKNGACIRQSQKSAKRQLGIGIEIPRELSPTMIHHSHGLYSIRQRYPIPRLRHATWGWKWNQKFFSVHKRITQNIHKESNKYAKLLDTILNCVGSWIMDNTPWTRRVRPIPYMSSLNSPYLKGLACSTHTSQAGTYHWSDQSAPIFQQVQYNRINRWR